MVGNSKIFFVVYFFLYVISSSLAIGAFMFLRPFTFIENAHTYVKCLNDQVSYEAGPNFIFVLDDKLDPFNDVKARKLCQYNIIKDYNGQYKTPEEINYLNLPEKQLSSSWPNAIFASFFVFFLFSASIEVGMKLVIKDINNLFFRSLWHYIGNLLD